MSPGHALELLFDPFDEARVRRTWQRLEDEGVPSMARHRGSTHRPHVTLVGGDAPGAAVGDLARVLLPPLLPVTAPVSGQVLLGGRRPILAHRLEVPEALHEVRRRLVDRWPGADRRPWVVHVSLTRRTDHRHLFVALAASAPRTTRGSTHDPSGEEVPSYRLVAARWWDPDTGTVSDLHGR